MLRHHSEAQARRPVYNDPWKRREAWRSHPIFSKASNFKTLFPGLGWATAAFAVYCTYEHFMLKDKKHH
ncbi:NADH-ubiquinone oxidoreductase B12 subunit family-domain-containing protein [Gongronella butleri]|nr:NADH-ubiquinone oxidoreductase B12 subunit family-domain-containing protein [Gongronella butleri]